MMEHVYILKRKPNVPRLFMAFSLLFFFMSFNYDYSSTAVFADDIILQMLMALLINVMISIKAIYDNRKRNTLIKEGECVWAHVDHTKTKTGLGAIYVYSSYEWKEEKIYKTFMGAEAPVTTKEYNRILDFIDHVEYVPVFVDKNDRDKFFSPVVGVVTNVQGKEKDVIRIINDGFSCRNKTVISNHDRTPGSIIIKYLGAIIGLTLLRILWWLLKRI